MQEPDVPFGKVMRSNGLKLQGKLFAMLVDGTPVVKLRKQRWTASLRLGEESALMPVTGG